MYCSTCGSAVSPNLSYCNHCGAKLGRADGENIAKPDPKPENLLFFITVVFIFGLAAIIGLMMAMKFVFGPENLGITIAFTLLSFLIMLGVEGLFVWLLLSRRKVGKPISKTDPLELDELRINMLPAPASSVTENTTRELEQKTQRRVE